MVIQVKYAAGPEIKHLGNLRPKRMASMRAQRAAGAGQLLKKWAVHNTARALYPDTTLARCHVQIVQAQDFVKVRRQGAGAWYSGLHTCKNVWCCPICAPRIAEARRGELQTAVDLAIGAGRGVYMTTFTIPHTRDEPLRALQRALALAQRRMKGTRDYKRLMADIGHIGDVRTLEVTYGAGGWHPHVHALNFLSSNLTATLRHRSAEERTRSVTRWRRRLYVLWARACLKADLGCPRYRGKDGKYVGVDIRGAHHAAGYVAKWGLAQELTGAHKKLGGAGSRTPWGLLADAHCGDAAAAARWVEFAKAMRGQRQLFWSPRLRKKLGLGEQLTDQQAIDWEPPEAETVAELTTDDWILVVAAGVRGELLEMAVQHPGRIEAALSRMRAEVRRQGIDIAAKGWRRNIRWDSIRGYWM